MGHPPLKNFTNDESIVFLNTPELKFRKREEIAQPCLTSSLKINRPWRCVLQT